MSKEFNNERKRDLFEGQRKEIQLKEVERGSAITKNEIEQVIKCTKTGEKTGPEIIEYGQLQIPSTFIPSIIYRNYHCRMAEIKLRNLSTQSNFKYSNHCTISLISNILKTVLKIIHGRVYRIIPNNCVKLYRQIPQDKKKSLYILIRRGKLLNYSFPNLIVVCILMLFSL